ncbi:MAG: GtrA family protein, partial [Prevotella sp.]|nr:GtrA family protein [Prevotella sp.]
AGFAFSHAVNYVLQMLTLNLFLWVGVPKQWAPIPMFCICVPVNFVLVRFFLKVKK